MYEITREDYIEKYGEMISRKYSEDAGEVWDVYHARVEYALDLIPRFRIADDSITQKYIRIALGVSAPMWNAMVKTFTRLYQVLNADRAYSKFKSELDLMKGIRASEYKNAKMLEMQLKLYNDDYIKSDEQKVELPKTLNINIDNKQMSNDELEKYSPKETED